MGKDTAIVPILIYHAIRPYIPSDSTSVRRYIATPDTKHHMTWDEVKELDAEGMQIGCHSLTHPFLQRIRSDDTLRREIFVSKQRIEEHIGTPVSSFAYPFGQYNERVISFVKAAGFTSARSTWPGVVHSPDGLFSLTGLIRTEATGSLIDTMTSYIDEAIVRDESTVPRGERRRALATGRGAG